MCLSLFGAGAIGNNVLGNTTFEWKTEVAPGTTFYDFSILTPTGASQQGFLTEYKPNNMVSPAVAYGSGIYGKSDLNYVRNYLEDQGKNVVMGMNADFFSLETGLPMGMVVSDGRLISGDDSRPSVGFMEDGTAFIGTPKLTTQLYIESGPILIEYVNKNRTVYNAYLLTNDFSEQTRNTTPGYDVFLKIPDGSFLQIGKPLTVVVERVEANTTSVPIPQGYMVLTVDANGPADRVAAVQALMPGQTATIMVQAEDSRYEKVRYAVGGAEILLAGGEIQPQSSSAVHPRSALGIKPDGTLAFFEMDGRQSGYSAGLSLADTAKFLKDMGCTEAINMDGGGSSTFAVQYPGEDGANIVNSPSDGAPRKCANFLFLINNTKPTQTAQKLFVYPSNNLILAGSKVEWTAKATDLNYNSAPLPQNISYSVPQNLGTITNGGVLTTAAQAQTGIIAVAGGSAAGSKEIQLIDSPDEIRVVKRGSTTTQSSLTLKAGETAALDVVAYKNGKVLRSSLDAFTITVSSEIGTMGEDMTFTAAGVEGKIGTITVTYKDITKTIPVSVGNAPIVAENFEERVNHWAVSAETQTRGGVSYETGFNYVRYGAASLGISYNFKGLLPEEKMMTAIPAFAANSLGSAQNLNLWVYGDGSKNKLQAQFAIEGGQMAVVLSGAIDFTGYKQISLPLPAGNKGVLTALSVAAAEGAKEEGKIYIDHITASFGGPLADETPPAIAVQEQDPAQQDLIVATVADSGGATLTSQNMMVMLDGQKIDFDYDPSSGRMTALIAPQLQGISQGIHKVTIEATDRSGNIGRMSMTKVIGQAQTDTSFADMGSHWSRDYVDFIAQRGVVAGVVENGAAYFQPERAINRAEFAVVMTRYLRLNAEDYAAVSVPFADMEKIPQWAVNYVKAMYAHGIILGRAAAENTVVFDPSAPVTRAEAATMMGKTLQKGYDSGKMVFSDQKVIPAWGIPYVKVLSALGVISGYEDKSFRPSNNVKRGEVAKMLYSLY